MTILTSDQKAFIKLFGKEKQISDKFYLSGGTALCEFYIPYRLSDDLDFFSEDEIELSEVLTFIKKIKPELSFNSFTHNTSFNRNLIFLDFGTYTLKTEFTYYPFERIDKTVRRLGISIDSLLDIAANKLFTIYQKPRARDFMDFYMIVQKEKLDFNDLMYKSWAKFDSHIDLVKLGTQLLLVDELVDLPRLLENTFDFENMKNYYKGLAHGLRGRVLDSSS